jgi:hypothetical protein
VSSLPGPTHAKKPRRLSLSSMNLIVSCDKERDSFETNTD